MSRQLLLLLPSCLLIACSSEATPSTITDAGADGGKSCTEGGKTYAHGATWECSDGCNSCSCVDGLVSSTIMACLEAGPDVRDANEAGKRCYQWPSGTHTSSTACPAPSAFGSIYLATFPCTEKCLQCPTSLSIVTAAVCDGTKWVAPSDIGCSDGSGTEWFHGAPPTCASDASTD